MITHERNLDRGDIGAAVIAVTKRRHGRAVFSQCQKCFTLLSARP